MAVDVAKEAKAVLAKLRKIFAHIDTEIFPDKCVVSTVRAFKDIWSQKIGSLVVEDISEADKYLWNLKFGPEEDPEKVRVRIRAKVSRELSVEMTTTQNDEDKAESAMNNSKEDKKCKATEDWAKAHLKTTAAVELFGQWSLIDVVDP